MSESDTKSPDTVRFTFRFVGPFKRSTLERGPVDRVEETLTDVFHWSWATRMQVDRLRYDVRTELEAWSCKRAHAARRAFSTTSADEQLLLVCAANLERALGRLPKKCREELQVSKQSRRALWLLRNIYEHWDELRRHFRGGTDDAKGTVAKLRKEFPAADPWSFTIDPERDEIILADIVALWSFVKELRELEARVLRLERARERHVKGAALKLKTTHKAAQK